MGGFAALLIGASDYRHKNISPLPFVTRDLEGLGGALRARGFRVVLPKAHGQVSANFVNGEIAAFLRAARSRENLLICLSGHGLHAEGEDYLIPEDVHGGLDPIWSGCVAINWRKEVERSHAGQVLFLIDACREGVHRGTMGASVGWASREALRVAGMKVAHFYACSPGESAHFVAPGGRPGQTRRGPDDSSFSLFSRAVLDTLLADRGPLNLEQLRVDVQARIEEFHRRHRKGGDAQRVRVITDVDHTEFLVAGPLRRATDLPATAPPADTPVRTLQPLGAAPAPSAPVLPADPWQLMAGAVYEAQTTGDTTHLAELAVVGPVELLLLNADWGNPAAIAAMWQAAAERRPVPALVDLAAGLCGANRSATAHDLLAAAAGARPADELLTALAALPAATADPLRETLLRALGALPAADLAGRATALYRAGYGDEAAQVLRTARPGPHSLPLLLSALDGAGLRAEAGRLVAEAVDRYGHTEVNLLLGALSRAGLAELRTAAVTAVAQGPVDRLVEHLAAWRTDTGPDADVEHALRTVLAGHRDRHLLPAALRRGGLEHHLATVFRGYAGLAPAELRPLLGRLVADGVQEDAEAVVLEAVRPFRPDRAAELAVLLCGDGPVALVGPVLGELCTTPVDQVAEFLARVEKSPELSEDDRHSLTAEAVPVLGARYPARALAGLFTALEGATSASVARGLLEVVVRTRSRADLVAVLATASDEQRGALLTRIVENPCPPGRLAELVHLPEHQELRRRIGDEVARSVAAGCSHQVLTAVLAELLVRQWTDGQELLLRHLAESPDTRLLVEVAQGLTGQGHWQQATDLLVSAASGLDTGRLVALLRSLLAAAEADLGRWLLEVATEGRPAADLVALVVDLLQDDGSPPYRRLADEGAGFLLRRAGQWPPEEVAELIVALDAVPQDARAPVGIAAVLRAYSGNRRAGDTEALLEALLRTGHQPGARITEAVRARTLELFAAVRRDGGGAGLRFLLAAVRCDLPMRDHEFSGLLAVLRTTGSDGEPALEQLARFQPALRMADLLNEFIHADAFDVLCRGLAERPVVEIVGVLGRSGHDVLRRFVEYAVRTVPRDRCRALLVGLLAGRQVAEATYLLEALHWNKDVEEFGELLIALDEPGLAGGEFARSAVVPRCVPFSPGTELLAYLNRRGARRAAFPVLCMLARRGDGSDNWLQLCRAGWFDHAAVLFDAARPEVNGADWCRELSRRLPGHDRAAFLHGTGGDRPVDELARNGARWSARTAALMYRPPEDVRALLVALADRPGERHRAVLWRVLAAVRPSDELALILAGLAAVGAVNEVFGVVDSVVSGEPVAKAVALLDPGPGSDAVVQLVRSPAAQEMLGRFLARLFRAGYGLRAGRLIDGLVLVDRDGALVAGMVERLALDGIPLKDRDRLTANYCWTRPAEEVARFLRRLDRPVTAADRDRALAMVADSSWAFFVKHYLDAQGDRHLSARLDDPTLRSGAPPEPRAPSRTWPWSRRRGGADGR
ncbi:caspase family protein [Kitasatospora phosalacinea]|uniref:Caspase family protein n=1 Tax=Kitasatospora phosalacinea TaxID=2065 RepID=A0ABW6GFY3_9ACTN